MLTGGDPVQLNYLSDDDDNIGGDGFTDAGPIPEHCNDEFPVMSNHDDVFSDNFTATNIHKYVNFTVVVL